MGSKPHYQILMTALNNPELNQLAKVLQKYELNHTIRCLAGLLTLPSLHANTLRLEILIHLAVIHCRGKIKPTLEEIGHWLNEYLGESSIVLEEDPTADVFVTNVGTPNGNRRLFEGTWYSSCYFVQAVIHILSHPKLLPQRQELLDSILALLNLSDCVAERVGLHRWHAEPSTPNGKIKLSPKIRIEERCNSVSFTPDDLAALKIKDAVLEPFLFKLENRKRLLSETLWHTSLERYPLLQLGKNLVLALPSAIGPAIRRFLLGQLQLKENLQTIAQLLASYQSYRIESEGLSTIENVEFLNSLCVDASDLPIQDWLLRVDLNSYLHVVLLNYPLESLNKDGLGNPLMYTEETETSLWNYLNQTVDHCMASPGKNDGTTLIVTGGLGGNCGLRLINWSNRWNLSLIHISDFLMLVNTPSQSLARFLKFIKQKKWVENQGILIQAITPGDYTLFCSWIGSGFRFGPRDLPLNPGSILFVDDSFTLDIRTKNRRTLDYHVIRTTRGNWVRVMRFFVDSYFDILKSRPIYVSIDHVRSGVLVGAIETERGPSWFSLRLPDKDYGIREFAYQFWSGFIELFFRLVVEVEKQNFNLQADPIEICIDLMDGVAFEVGAGLQSTVEPTKIRILARELTAIVKLPPIFLQYFQKPENYGERHVVRCIAKALLKLHMVEVEDFDDSIIESLVDKVVGDSSIRLLHAFTIQDKVEELLHKHNKNLVLIPKEDLEFVKLNLSEGSRPTDNSSNIVSRSACNEFLNKVVVKIWNQLRDQLNVLDRASVIQSLFYVHESIIRDRNRWRETAKAVQALYGLTENFHENVQEQEGERTITDLAVRTVMEMAICECPTSGGSPLSQEQMEDLLARSAVMQEAAAHSDGIRTKLIDPLIELHSNGSYSIKHDFIHTVVRPFLVAHFTDEFGKAASNYHELYQDNLTDKVMLIEEIYSDDFLEAFEAEFGISLRDTIEGFAEVFNLAIERDQIVVISTLGEIKSRLVSNRGFSNDIIDAFLFAFGIFHRAAWNIPPSGMKNRDISPWRYSRRLSVAFRPLLVFGKLDKDAVIYGVGTVKMVFQNLLSKIEHGYLPQEFFRSSSMKSYLGMITNKRGHEFTKTVGEHLKSEGWSTRVEVKMSELGAPSELGDIDVLAWKPNGDILIVECKRLRIARTLHEIAEICRRFRGQAKDELHKHLRRFNWIKNNLPSFNRITGLTENSIKIDQRLVTNVQVPMKFLSNLPIPNDKIGPLGSFEA